MGSVSNPARVFIIQQPRPKSDGWTPNFEPATQFGRLHFIFDAGDRAYADPKAAIKKAYNKLLDFDDQKDFLLSAGFGDPFCAILVDILLAKLGHTPQYLYWSRGRGPNGEMTNETGYYFPLPTAAVNEFLMKLPKK